MEIHEHVVVGTPISAPMPNLKLSIPYPSRRTDEKRREKTNDLIEKFLQIFQILCFEANVGNGTQINVSTPHSSNDSPSVANHPPQPQCVPYSRELRGNDSHYGYDCPPQVPFVYNQDPLQPPQYTVNHPIFNSQNELLNSQNKLMEQMATLRDLVDQAIQKKEEEKRIAEEQAARDRSWKIPVCYDDDCKTIH
ncbi:hypothetical protein Tco_0449133 [Tanacetum coccineum]